MQGSVYTPFCAKTLARTGKLVTSVSVGDRELVLTCRKNSVEFSVKLLGDTLINKTLPLHRYDALAQALVIGFALNDNYSGFVQELKA